MPATSSSFIAKARTGIAGLDDMTRGGLPVGRVTLIEGGPGSGKTLLALRTLAHGAGVDGEPGIFVAFEESPGNIKDNIASLNWARAESWEDSVFFLDAQPSPDTVHSGGFDLGGLLAILGAKAKEMGARRIVFDAIDVLLALLPHAAARRRELYRLHHWLLAQPMTAIITAKAADAEGAAPDLEALGFLQFMVDCAITLRRDVVGGISQRSLRVLKYRGSGFTENQAPLLIGQQGIEVSYATFQPEASAAVTDERVSTGVARLDAMLEGGYHRGASILISGSPGTAKTTLCGAFAHAACQRGERTLFVSFDSPAAELIRNIGSVGIELAPYVEKGLLRCFATRSLAGSAEVHLTRIKATAREHGARCVIIDPLSALTMDGNIYSHSVAERLIDWAKTEGITLLCTTLLGQLHHADENTPLLVSAIADTWIHLSYVVHAGERNRALTIVKSRGTGHSNQVREMLLSNDGVTLDDVYLADGEVLMGTLRWAAEREEALVRAETRAEAELQRLRLGTEAAEIEGRLGLLHRQLEVKQAEYAALLRAGAELGAEEMRTKVELRRRRGADRLAPEVNHA
jgi:circadian clock protein KaiC